MCLIFGEILTGMVSYHPSVKTHYGCPTVLMRISMPDKYVSQLCAISTPTPHFKTIVLYYSHHTKLRKNFLGFEIVFRFWTFIFVHFSKVNRSSRKNLDFLDPYHNGHNFFQGFFTYGLKSFQ